MPDTKRVKDLKVIMSKIELPDDFICVPYVEPDKNVPEWKPICKTYYRLDENRIHPSAREKYRGFQLDPKDITYYLIPITTLYISEDDLSYKLIVDILDRTFKPPQVIVTEMLKVRNTVEETVKEFFEGGAKC